MNDLNQKAEPSQQKSGESRKFVSSIFWVGIAMVFNQLIVGVGTMPVLTKTYSSALFGIWTQITITYQLLGTLVSLSLNLAVVRFLSGKSDKNERRRTVGAMLFAITVVSVVFLIFANALASQFSVLLFNSPDYIVFVRLTALWTVVNAYMIFFISYMLSQGKIVLLSVRQVVCDILAFGVVVFMASNGMRLEWVVAGVIAVWTLFTLVFFFMIVRETGWPWPNTNGLKSFLAFSVPQMPAGILLWIISSSDRYLIIHFYGLSEAGIYTSSRSLGGLLWLLYYPIQFVLFPTISRLWEEQHFNGVKQYLEQSTKLFLIVAIPAVAGIAILSQPLLRILTTSQYLIGSTLVLCTATGALFMGIYSINVNIVYLRKQTKLLPLMIGGASVINILLNLILLPRVGLIGAAISNIVSFFVLAVVVSIWARKQVGYGMHPLLILKIIGATLIMSVCLYFIKAHSLLAVVLSGFVAIIVLVISLFLLKAFSEDDKKLIKNIISGFLPGIDK